MEFNFKDGGNILWVQSHYKYKSWILPGNQSSVEMWGCLLDEQETREKQVKYHWVCLKFKAKRQNINSVQKQVGKGQHCTSSVTLTHFLAWTSITLVILKEFHFVICCSNINFCKIPLFLIRIPIYNNEKKNVLSKETANYHISTSLEALGRILTQSKMPEP